MTDPTPFKVNIDTEPGRRAIEELKTAAARMPAAFNEATDQANILGFTAWFGLKAGPPAKGENPFKLPPGGPDL